MPNPEGFTVKKPRRNRNAGNPFAKNLLGSIADPIEHTLNGADGKSIKISCVMDSPLIQMLNMTFGLAESNPDQEAIGYNEQKGMLEKKGDNGFNLQIILWGKHLITIVTKGISEEDLFKWFNQEWVDKIAALLGK